MGGRDAFHPMDMRVPHHKPHHNRVILVSLWYQSPVNTVESTTGVERYIRTLGLIIRCCWFAGQDRRFYIDEREYLNVSARPSK
jgi:hypothetical protein